MRLALFWRKIYLKVITQLKNISPIEVKNVILKLNASKAAGYDRISPKLLKGSAEIIAESLTASYFQ